MKKTGYAPVHKGELYYEIEGDANHPAVVFLHACICNHTMWDPQMAAFTQRYRVLRYDLRSFGQSRTQDTSYSSRQDLLDVMNVVGIDRAAIIGCSCGGQIALDFTLEHPDRVSALVSVCGGISGAEPSQDWLQSDEAKYFEHLDSLYEAKKMDELLERELHLWVNGRTQAQNRAPQALLAQVREMIRDSYTRQDGKAEAQPMQPPAVGRLGEVRVPTLFVLGEHDTSGAHTAADMIVQGVHGARSLTLPDSAHVPSMEHPDAFNRAVLAFLAS